jgi:DNA polymerase sigma
LSKIEIDISVNKILEIQNSRLIRAYAQLDRRFVRLAIVLKIWNKRLFNNKQTRLNSYTLNLMLIAFMQHLKILPSL